jgi:hypothetical protein
MFKFKKNYNIPKSRYLYAIKNGDHAGKFIAYIATLKGDHCFLSIPGNEKLKVPIKDFDNGVAADLVSFVEILPKNIYKVIVAQHNCCN